MEQFMAPLWLSLKLAVFTTLILAFIGVVSGYVLHMFSFRGKSLIRAIVALPLVLPPTVLGYYLLVAMQPDSVAGGVFEKLFGIRMVFSFYGILLGSIVFSLPFMVSPILSGLDALPKSLMEASFTLGKTRLQTFFKVLVPNIKSSLFAAFIMTFAHTIGEFGVVLMIGGNIPGQTRVASIAIFHEMEAMNYDVANQYAMVLLVFSLVIIFLVQWLQKRIALW
ncbi:molybdate ABC transporter permease subunit [uncultured Imperialibacter sp.]|uniref:molybdate ABC transporter permease subunit n=1 Tax=uncultured Imperialibacter sp. TaxID=1672639 RepID=UPI0030DC73EE|tara:strand:- start:1579 stop:2247 length:669 start_codon:yes stop_codon:yes gene_type:complete